MKQEDWWLVFRSVRINVSLLALFGINDAAALDIVSSAAVLVFGRNAAGGGA